MGVGPGPPAKSLSIDVPPRARMPGAERRLTIPEEIAQEIDRRIAGSGFKDADAFVSFVLARILENPSDVPFSQEDERKVREKLRSLGYID